MKAPFPITYVFSSGLNWACRRNISTLSSSVNLALSPLRSYKDETSFLNCLIPILTRSNFVSDERINGCTTRNHDASMHKLCYYSTPKFVEIDNDKIEVIKSILAQKGWSNGYFDFPDVGLDEESVIKVLNGLFDETSDARFSLWFFRWLEVSFGFKHTLRSICSLINVLVLGNMNPKVVDLIECLIHNNFLPEELVKILQEICGRKVLKTVYSMLVHCYNKENMIGEALQVKCMVEDFDIFPSKKACHSLIKSLLDSDREELAWDLLEKMQDQGLVCTITISLFINYYCSKGNLECGWKLLTHMKSYGMKLDVVAYTPFIRFLCKMCYVKEATSLVFKMIQMGIFPDLVLLTSIIYGYCKVERPEYAVVVVKLFGVVPDVFVYNSFISQLCKDCDMQKASAVFHEMLDSYVRPDCHVYTTMISGYCETGNMKKALQYLGRMLKDGIEPSIVTYNILIDSYCRSEDMETAQYLFQKMTTKGLKPDIIVYNTLINGYMNNGTLEKAYELLGMMISVGILPDIVTYNIIIHGLVVRGFVSEANDMLYELTRRGLCLDVVTYTPVVHGYSKKGQFTDAFSAWEHMIGSNVTPDVITCSALISGYSKAGDIDKAHALFREIIGAGLIPDLIMYNTLVHGFCRIGNIEETCHLIEVMIKNNVIPNDVTYKALILCYEKQHVNDPVKSAAYKIQEILHRHGVYVNQSYCS